MPAGWKDRVRDSDRQPQMPGEGYENEDGENITGLGNEWFTGDL